MSEETEKVVKINIQSHDSDEADSDKTNIDADNQVLDDKETETTQEIGENEPKEVKAEPITEPDNTGTESLKTEIEAAKQSSQENYDRFLRVSADFENYKKRSERDMNNLRKFANETLIRQLLPVADSMERAILSCQEDAKAKGNATEDLGSVIDGVNLVYTELVKFLEKQNVTPIESINKPFDPAVHEAVMQEENDDFPDNTVLKEFRKGYLIHDRLLRPAMVVVSKTKPNAGDQLES